MTLQHTYSTTAHYLSAIFASALCLIESYICAGAHEYGNMIVLFINLLGKGLTQEISRHNRGS